MKSFTRNFSREVNWVRPCDLHICLPQYSSHAEIRGTCSERLSDFQVRKKQTFTIVTKGSKAARYDGAIQILIYLLFFEKVAVRKDARVVAVRRWRPPRSYICSHESMMKISDAGKGSLCCRWFKWRASTKNTLRERENLPIVYCVRMNECMSLYDADPLPSIFISIHSSE